MSEDDTNGVAKQWSADYRRRARLVRICEARVPCRNCSYDRFAAGRTSTPALTLLKMGKSVGSGNGRAAGQSSGTTAANVGFPVADACVFANGEGFCVVEVIGRKPDDASFVHL